jgi:methyl coenzyme M reductase subunit C
MFRWTRRTPCGTDNWVLPRNGTGSDRTSERVEQQRNHACTKGGIRQHIVEEIANVLHDEDVPELIVAMLPIAHALKAVPVADARR